MKNAIAVLLLMIVSFFVTPVHAHGGEDHQHDEPTATALPQNISPRLEINGEKTEIVMQLHDGRLRMQIDDWASNDPINDATVQVQWNDHLMDAQAINHGVYLTPVLPTPLPEHISLVISIQYKDINELLNAEWHLPETITANDEHHHWPQWASLLLLSLTMFGLGFLFNRRMNKTHALCLVGLTSLFGHDARAHGDETHAVEETAQSKLIQAEDRAQRLPDGSWFIPKPVQHILQLRTRATEFAERAFVARLPAEVQPDPQHGGRVQAQQNGIVRAAKRWPVPGQSVKKGDVLLRVQAQFNAVERAQIQAQLAKLNAQLPVVEQRLQRLHSISETVTRKELDELRAEHEGLQAERRSLQHALNGFDDIRSPMNGTIARVHVSADEPVNAQQLLLDVIGDHLIVQAYASSDFVPGKNLKAEFIHDNKRAVLRWLGRGRALQDQQVPLLFALTDTEKQFVLGESGVVLIETDIQQSGMLLPLQALVRHEDGSKAVFIKLSAEKFRLQTVHVQPLPGEQVLVLSGLTAGTRVVIDGAQMLAQLQ